MLQVVLAEQPFKIADDLKEKELQFLEAAVLEMQNVRRCLMRDESLIR